MLTAFTLAWNYNLSPMKYERAEAIVDVNLLSIAEANLLVIGGSKCTLSELGPAVPW